MLTTWDSNKELSNHEILEYLELDDLRRLMERLAYWIHCQGGTGDTEGGTLIDREALIAQLTQYIREMKKVERYEAKAEAKRFLELIVRDRAGLLSLQGQDRYAFVHKTFQEYLTAMEIRDRQEDGFDVVIEHVEKYLHDAHWEEVLLLLIAQQKRKNPAKILRCVLDHGSDYEQWLHRDLLFAGTILTENVPLSEDNLADSILDRLIGLETSTSPLVNHKLREQVFKIVENLFETAFEKVAILMLNREQETFEQLRFLSYLGTLMPDKAATSLLELLKDDDSDVRYGAAESLGQLGNTNDIVIHALLERLKDDDSDVRYHAAESLGQLGNANDIVIHALLERLKDDDSDVRYGAAASLGQLGNANDIVIHALLERLKDDDSDVRYHAAESLGQLGNANDIVIHALLERLKDDDSDVRYRAAASLGQLGNANDIVIHALLERLKDDNWTVRSRAAESLGQLSTQSKTLEPLLVQWIEQHQTEKFVSHGVDVLSTLIG